MRIYLFLLLLAAAVTFLVTPAVRLLARRAGAMTAVRERDVHVVPIPRLGGAAMFLGYAAATLVAWRMPFLRQVFESGELIGILIGAGVVCLVGAIDDVRELAARLPALWRFVEAPSLYGHDAFLKEDALVGDILRTALKDIVA